MAKKKYYVVWEGAQTGIFDSWNECKLAIAGYPGAKYKSFKTKEAAEEALYEGAREHIGKDKKEKPSISEEERKKIVWDSISVDAACSGNPGKMEYRGVDTKTKAEIFRQGPFVGGTNNVGEFLALVHVLALLKKAGKNTPVYSDSRTAMAWVRKKRANTTMKQNPQNKILFMLIQRAETWLKNNTYSNIIMKWDTPNWGEIPADFGRK